MLSCGFFSSKIFNYWFVTFKWHDRSYNTPGFAENWISRVTIQCLYLYFFGCLYAYNIVKVLKYFTCFEINHFLSFCMKDHQISMSMQQHYISLIIYQLHFKSIFQLQHILWMFESVEYLLAGILEKRMLEAEFNSWPIKTCLQNGRKTLGNLDCCILSRLLIILTLIELAK